MKTKVGGSGVNAANRFEILKRIESNPNYWDYRVERLSASQLREVWNYRAEGLNLPAAKEELFKAITEKEKINEKRRNARYFSTTWREEKYLKMQEEKRNSIRLFLKRVESMAPAQDYFRYSYGNYKYQHRTFRLEHNNFPVTVTVTVYWSEDHDWDYYAKSYSRPKSTYSDRAVIFKSIGKLGREEEIFRFDLNSFAGNFMEKAIAAFLRVRKVKCSKELKPIQLADYFKVKETHKINGYRIFERYIGVLWDYAILDTKTGTTYHAWKKEDLVSGLRAKLQAKIDHETEEITKDTGYRLGFCETGMRQFCSDNNVDFEGVYTRQELRNIVIANRSINCKKYRTELSKIGIILNCK